MLVSIVPAPALVMSLDWGQETIRALRPITGRNHVKSNLYSPGRMELHLIPIGPKAIAQLSIKLLIPAFVGV